MKTLISIQKTKKRLGRGGGRGQQSGRGHKGQKARAGNRIRPAIRDTLQRIPKRRGHNKNRARGVRFKIPMHSVNLDIIEKNFGKEEKVTPKILMEKKLVRRIKGKIPSVKIVKKGKLTKSVLVRNCSTTAGAKEVIEKAGGNVQ